MKWHGDAANPEAQEMFSMQGDALDHLRNHLNSLLEISRLDAGDVELEIAETSMLEMFKRLQEEFEPAAQTKGLKLHFDSQAEVVYSDRKLLTQSVRRMVSNAVRYTHSGNVNVYCRRETGGLRVTVQDSGIGIAPDQLAFIFDEFYRVEKDPAGRNVGLGLGLSITLSVTSGVQPDIMICDYRLVGNDGVEVVRKVRDALAGEIPSIILTGDTSHPREIAEAGLPNCTVVHKPVNPDRLGSLVRSLAPGQESAQ